MLTAALVAYAHFVAAFVLVATLVYEWASFSRAPSLQEARRLAMADRFYGLSAGLLIAAGFVRAIWFEKGWAFYQHNAMFHAKLGLFIVIGLLSIVPTVQFIRWGKSLKAGQAPVVSEAEHRRVRLCLNLQMALLPVLALCASLMAKGIGS